MFRFEVLTVGKELLIGRTLNTNAHWVVARLARRGTMIREIVTVDDNIDEISAAFRAAVTRRPDFLLVIGVRGVIAGDNFQRAVGHAGQHRLPVIGGADGRVHFEMRVVARPAWAVLRC